MSTKFFPKSPVKTPHGEGVVLYVRNAAPDFKEIEGVACLVDGVEHEYSPESIELLAVPEPSPSTDREPKKAKTVKMNIAFQKADGNLLPKSEFLVLMAAEYDRLAEELGIGNFEDIEAAVLAAFAEHKGARYNLAYLHSCVLKALKPEGVEGWKKLDKRFKTYFDIKTGPKESGALYGVKTGKGNGHYLWADYTEEAPKA